MTRLRREFRPTQIYPLTEGQASGLRSIFGDDWAEQWAFWRMYPRMRRIRVGDGQIVDRPRATFSVRSMRSVGSRAVRGDATFARRKGRLLNRGHRSR